MSEHQRLSLKDAGTVLGLTESGVRARFKAGKLEGERDNHGKIWVFVTPETEPRVQAAQRPQNEDGRAYRELVDTLKQQVASLTAERDELRSHADEATRLGAQLIEVEAQLDLERVYRKSEQEHRHRAEENVATAQAQVERLTDLLTQQTRPQSLWKRLFG